VRWRSDPTWARRGVARTGPKGERETELERSEDGLPLTAWPAFRLVRKGRAAVKPHAGGFQPGLTRTYETSELGARRPFGHVLDDQHHDSSSRAGQEDPESPPKV
jgi:hypothetical protein